MVRELVRWGGEQGWQAIEAIAYKAIPAFYDARIYEVGYHLGEAHKFVPPSSFQEVFG